MSSNHGGVEASGLTGVKVGIKRFGNSVQLTLQCSGDYHAIEVYDRVVEGAQNGKVTIDLNLR
jgi:hypothetical protein